MLQALDFGDDFLEGLAIAQEEGDCVDELIERLLT
jgi:hypothetical protein